MKRLLHPDHICYSCVNNSWDTVCENIGKPADNLCFEVCRCDSECLRRNPGKMVVIEDEIRM